ncbi:MAG: DUF998 domain-containing protein [bacterium]
MRPRVLAWLGLVGIAEFTAAILVLHLTALRKEPEHMSQFANTRYALLWNLAIFSFTIGGAALSLAIRPHLEHGLFRRAGLWMIWLSVVGAILLTTFPMDGGYQAPTMAGAIHGGAAFSMFMLLGIAMIVLAPAFRKSPVWRSFAYPSLVIGMLVSACGITYLVATLNSMELAAFAQRIMVGFIATWFILLGVRLLKVPGSVQAPPAPVGALAVAT